MCWIQIQNSVNGLVHSGALPFKCDLCSNKFTQKSSLNTHMKAHTNPCPRPVKFQCSVCARNFFENSEKVAHQSNCKCRRYECYLCQSYMTHHKRQLQYNMRKPHTGGRPFNCKFCVKCYASHSNMNYHMKRVHKQ